MNARRHSIAGTQQREYVLHWLLGGALISGIGAVAIFNTTAPLAPEHTVPPHFLRHLGALALGAPLVFAAAKAKLELWRKLALPLWAVSVLALAATLVFGHSAGGAARWLPLPGLGVAVQPAEFVKFTTVLAVAAVLSSRGVREELSWRQWAFALSLAGLPAALCILQPDFGSAVILALLVFGLIFVAGGRVGVLLGLGAVGALFSGAYIARHPYALRRLVGFLDPWNKDQAEGFQLVQSYIAFGHGGLGGAGIGNGKQKLFFLPEAHNDFILSAIAEESGLLGVLVLLGAFCWLMLTGLRIALRAQGRFALLLAAGATALLILPAMLNAAVAMGCLPTKGLALPLVSYGRSSLLASLLSLGLVLSVARSGPARRRRQP